MDQEKNFAWKVLIMMCHMAPSPITGWWSVCFNLDC